MRENLLTSHYSIFLMKNHPWNEVLKSKIDRLIQSGIIQKLEEKRFKATMQAEKTKTEDDAKVLNMDHLGLCFYVILIFLGLSFVVFVLECLVGYFKN